MMTIEQKRILLAEADGWTEIQWSELINPRIAIENKHFCRDTEQFRCLWLPDYFNDLNAVHELEGVLTFGQYDAFCEHLGGSLFSCARATAAQRAEALGLTLKLWK